MQSSFPQLVASLKVYSEAIAFAVTLAGIMWAVLKYKPERPPLLVWVSAKWDRRPSARLDKIETKIDIILKEMQPNGGGSISDRVGEASAGIKRLEKSINNLTARQDANIELSAIPTYRCDSQGRVDYVNPAWCELWGLTPQEAHGDGWRQGIYRPDMAEIEAAGKIHYSDQTRIKFRIANRRDKKLITVVSTNYFYRGEDKQLIWSKGTLVVKKTEPLPPRGGNGLN